jgi:hypothetical protein
MNLNLNSANNEGSDEITNENRTNQQPHYKALNPLLNRIIQRFWNAVVSAVKINPQEIVTPSKVVKSNHVDKR